MVRTSHRALDAAGNRSSDSLFSSSVGTWSYDNLNRMLTTPRFAGSGSINQGWSYEHDILGNRTGRNASAWSAYPMRYDWDVLNRATLIAQPSGGASYAYRADGQRIEKVEGATFSWSGPRNSGQYDTNYATNRPSSRYYYDGQMGFEDDYNPSGTVTQVNRYILGARGIDRVARTESGNTTLAYPMYDGHGHMRALLSRNGTSYSTGNWKTYDVWGFVRSGGSSGDPKQGYVASIGHVSDSESSLIYMRARYYEPATGRFLSQDPHLAGNNWFIYCNNNGTNLVDFSGKVPWKQVYLWLFDLEAATCFSPQGKVILNAFCLMWTIELMALPGSGLAGALGGFDAMEYLKMWYFVGEARAIGLTATFPGSIKDQAAGEAKTYSLCLIVSFWIIGEGGNLL